MKLKVIFLLLLGTSVFASVIIKTGVPKLEENSAVPQPAAVAASLKAVDAASLLTIATNTLNAKPPVANVHKPETGALPTGNNFTQGVPGDDYDLTMAYQTPMTTGELGGFDTFNLVDTSQSAPGANFVATVYGNPSTSYADKAGDRFILGDALLPYYVGSVISGIDQGFMHIFNFELAGSEIVLHGTAADYALVNVGGTWAGTALFKITNGSADMVAHFHDRTLSSLNVAPFVYVNASNTPAALAAVSDGAQIGGTGTNIVLDIEVDNRGGVYVLGVSRDDLRNSYANVSGQGQMFIAKYNNGQRVWLRQFGSDNAEIDFSFDFSIKENDILVTGRYLSTVQGGQKDAFMARIDTETGALRANALFSGRGAQVGANITSDDAGFVYVSGIGIDDSIVTNDSHAQDPYVEKRRRSDLSLVKRTIYGAGTNKEPWGGLKFINDNSGVPGKGRLYSAGWTFEGFDLPESGNGTPGAVGNRNAWVSAFDQDMNFLWHEEWSSPGDHVEWPWDMDVDSQGFIYVAGLTYGSLDGSNSQKGQGDGFITKIDPSKPSGQRIVWSRNIGTTSSDEIRRIRVVGDRLYVAGHTYGAFPGYTNKGRSDAWVGQLDLNGQLLMAQQFGTAHDERAHLAVDGDYVHVAGATEGSLAGPNEGSVDGYLMKLNRNLSFINPAPKALQNADQYDLSGGWYEVETDGQGIQIEIYDSPSRGPGTKPYLFGGWFTYTDVSGGPEQHAWFTLEGEGVPGSKSFVLDISKTNAGVFDSLPSVTPFSVGQAVITFESCTQATLEYTFNIAYAYRNGKIRLQRFLKNISCEEETRVANAPRSFLNTGAWYEPVTAGQGLMFEVNPEQRYFFGAWYTYGNAAINGHRWYTLELGNINPDFRNYSSIGIYETTKGVFDKPGAQQARLVGEADISFLNCSQSQLSYRFTQGELNGSTGVIPLSRLGPKPVECVD
jgi:hypothetical protein